MNRWQHEHEHLKNSSHHNSAILDNVNENIKIDKQFIESLSRNQNKTFHETNLDNGFPCQRRNQDTVAHHSRSLYKVLLIKWDNQFPVVLQTFKEKEKQLNCGFCDHQTLINLKY